MYKILGDDGLEYGPVSGEQVKKWIREGRLEKKSPVYPKGAGDWIFLGSLPEFAAEFGPEVDEPAFSEAGGPILNPAARMAFYFGIFAVIPIVGALLGCIGLVAGLRGLAVYRQNPAAGGKLQAWVGIVLGGLFGLGYWVWIVLAVMAATAHKLGSG